MRLPGVRIALVSVHVLVSIAVKALRDRFLSGSPELIPLVIPLVHIRVATALRPSHGG